MPYHIRRMKHRYPVVFRYIQTCVLLITAILASGINTQLLGQTCVGTNKTIFKETFGTGTGYGPRLTYDTGAPTDLLNGATSYTYWEPSNPCGYPVNATCYPYPNDKWYTIASSPLKAKNDWIDIKDHTGDLNGKMLIVNAAPDQPNTFYKRRVRNICQNTLITFSAWFVEINGPGSFTICSGEPNGEPRVSDVAFIIRDTLGNTVDTVRTGPIHARLDGKQTWAKYSVSFYTGPNTSFDVSLVNRAPGSCGNDLAIDDIELDACVPVFTALPPTGNICLKNNVVFTSHLTSSYNPPVFRWYSSKDNGVTWNPVPGAADSTLQINSVQITDNGTLYRVIAAGSLADILSAGLSNSCSVTSNSVPLKITQSNVLFGPIPSICQSNGLVDLSKYVTKYNAQSSFGGNGITGVFFDPLKVLPGSKTDLVYSYINDTTTCQTDVKASVTVIAAPLPVITTPYGNLACAGKTVEMDLSGVDASDDIKWIDSTGVVRGTGLSFKAQVSGTYTAVVTNPGGCIGKASHAVTINPSPGSKIDQGTGSKICAGGSVTLTTSTPGSNHWTYNNKLIISTNQSSIVVKKDGLYTLAVTNASGCSDSTSYYLTVNPLPLPKIAYLTSTTFCPGGVINFDAASFNNALNTYVSFQWLNNGVAIVPAATGKSYLATTAGSYTLQVVDVNGCTGISPPVVVTIKPTPPAPLISASGPLTTCKGTPLSLTVTNYNPAYTYQFQKNGIALPGTDVKTYFPQVSGTYTVQVTDTVSKCSKGSASVTVTINPVPVASVGFTILSICTNGNAAHDQVTLTASVSPVGSYTYQWYMNGTPSGPPTPPSPSSSYAATVTGQYYFTATSAGGCTGTASPVQVTISSPPHPVIQPSKNYSANFCNPLPGYTYLELATGPPPVTSYKSYQWYRNGVLIPGETSAYLKATAGGNYQLEVVNAGGCTGLSTPLAVSAYPPANPTLSPSSLPTALCQGETQVLTANQSGTLQWWNGNKLLSATGSSITVSTPGRYYYTFTDTYGCHSTSNVVPVQVHANPPANIYAKSTSGVLKFCNGVNALTLHMYSVYPKDSASFEWHHFDPATGTDLIVQTAVLNDSTYAVGTNPAKDPGNYYVKVTYVPVGCSAKSNVINVRFDKPPVASLGGDIICYGKPVVLVSPPGVTFAWEYSTTYAPFPWPAAPGATATQTKYNAIAPGFYRVKVTDAAGCANYSDTVSLTEGHHLVVAVTPTNSTICKGGFTQFTATVTGGGQADPAGTFYTYHWFHNGVPAQGGAFNTIGADTSGVWSVMVDRVGYCTGNASGTLTVNTPAKPVLSPSPIVVACEGTTPILSVTNASKFITYTWLRNLFPINGYTGTQSSTYPVTEFGDYRVIGTDAANGCTDTSTVTTVNYEKLPQPSIYTTGPTIFCEGGSTQIYADSTTASGKSGTDTFLWALSTTSAGPYTPIQGAKYARLTVNAPGYYQVTQTTSTGCVGKTNILIETFPVKTPVITGVSYVCDSSTTTLSSNISNPGEFEWDYATVGNYISNQPTIAVSQPGVYYLVARNASNTSCTKTTSITITVAPLPVVSYAMADSCQTINSATFVNQSKISDGTALKYSWDFGDPGSGVKNIDTSTNGIHLYPSPVLPVKYPVTLTVTSTQGCSRSYKQSFLFKGARPVASFTAGGGGTLCASQPMLLADKSTISTGSIVTYAWSIYDAAGNHLPIAIDSLATPKVMLPDSTKSAVYTIFHTVIGNSGCLDITSKSVTVSGALKAKLNLRVTQFCTTTPPDSLRGGTPKSGYSNVVGAYSGTGVKAGIFYPAIAGVGKFQITYTIVNATTGCSSFATDSINVAQGPAIVKLSAPATYKPCDTSVLLTAKGTGAVLYSWYYKLASGKDSLLRSGPQDTLSTSTGGNYFVRVSNAFGCYTDATIPLTIYPHPKPAFALAEVCSNLVSTFTNTSTISDKSAMKYLWNFGDPLSGANNTTTSPVPVHQFSSPATYTVTLTATSTKGCTQSFAQQVMISNLDSLVNFTINTNAPYCMSEPVVFIDSTIIPDRTIRSYRWIFLDAAGNVLNLTSDTTGIVSVIFPVVTTPTKFTVREIVITTDNCPLQSKDRTITINPLTPVTYVREHPRDVCRLDPPFPLTGGETVPPGQAGKGYYAGDGVMNGSTFNPLKVLGGDNTVSYVFTNQYGCVSTASTVYTVHDTLTLSPRVTNFDVLEGDQVTLNGIGTLPFIFGPNYVTSLTADSLKWAWTPATGLSSTSVPVPTLTAGVTTTYTLTVTPPFGCPSRAVFVVVVHKRLHIPNAFSPNGDGINDPWVIQGIDNYPRAEVFIFNRWGQQLWYSKGYGTPWNGFYNGKPLPMGTYYYLIKLNKKGYEQPLSGPLTLIY